MRSWGMVGAAAVVATAAIGAGITWTVWSHRPARRVPTCTRILTPTVTVAVQTAFSTAWDQRRTNFADLNDSAMCYIDAELLYLDRVRPEAETVRSRSLYLHVFQEDPQRFRRRQLECQPQPDVTDPADERGLGDEAFGCWTTHEVKPFTYLRRRLDFRVGEITFLLSLSGADYGPQPDAEHMALLRGDLARNTRCIAEALAPRFDGTVVPATACGTPSDL